MPIFLLQGVDEVHPWAVGLIMTSFVFIFWIFALGIKRHINEKSRAREGLLRGMSREMHLGLHHFAEGDKPTVYGYDERMIPLLRAYGKVDDLKMAINGWDALFSESDCFIPSDESVCYMQGEYEGHMVLVGDMCPLRGNAALDEEYSDRGPAFFRDAGTDATGIATYWDGMKLPRASIVPRGHRMPPGVKADGFVGSASFNVAFCVQGDDEAGIVDMMNKEFTDWCKAHPKHSLEVFESGLVTYLSTTMMTAKQIKEGVDAAVELAEILETSQNG
jgi:hypothetical protein